MYLEQRWQTHNFHRYNDTARWLVHDTTTRNILRFTNLTLFDQIIVRKCQYEKKRTTKTKHIFPRESDDGAETSRIFASRKSDYIVEIGNNYLADLNLKFILIY